MTLQDDTTGRYAEQLLDHAQHHTGAVFVVLSQPELTDAPSDWQPILLFWRKAIRHENTNVQPQVGGSAFIPVSG